ncbi:hypothetical protein HDU96_008089 [Phlyctochytrium bullatum]|nr:hypothetical protein HDU96_008089 [Phlyctochytrium bullatum]
MTVQDVAIAVTVSTLALASALFLTYRNSRRTKLGGQVAVSTASVAYDRDRYSNAFSWDKHTFYIDGKPVLLISGEFHPWRIPDRDRWRTILEQYKAAGLNCIRIYFHWGYHSPAEGVYYFDGNRDMDYLLSLCEELRLFVLAAPGPYICAETQGGGIPPWLIAKRDVRIRHSVSTFFKSYDEKYSNYCREWLLAILPIIARHQITNSTPSPSGRRGCVLALQIENENFECLFGIPIGLSDDMRFLANVARKECGITVPLFHNDAFEEGSFVGYHPSKRVFGKDHFGLDLYSFDKYVVFAPTSAPLSTITAGEERHQAWKPWQITDVTKNVDKMEQKVRAFGGCAATAPIFIAELQGGWFNHYKLNCTYDTIYEYYGESYTKLLVESVFAQGVTAFNIYMFYGGTNWGTVGDPDVYTSYDYSACIREYNFLSGRARKLRLAISFARSFADVFGKTEAIPESSYTVKVTPAGAFNRQRVSVSSKDAEFTFLRNFEEKSDGKLTIRLNSRPAIALKATLPYKNSFIALGNYRSQTSGLHLLLASLPILGRTHIINAAGKKSEVWFVQNDDLISGQLAFDGQVVVKSASKQLQPTVEKNEIARVSVVSFPLGQGWFSLSTGDDKGELYVVALAGDDVYTFNPSFEESYWLTNKDDASAASSTDPFAVSWGAFNCRYDAVAGTYEVEAFRPDVKVYALLSNSDKLLKSGFVAVAADSPFAGFPGLAVYRPVAVHKPIAPAVQFGSWSYRMSEFDQYEWKDLQVAKDRPVENVVDLLYTSGHSFYKLSFKSDGEAKPIKLSITLRNRAVLYLNNTVIGGHTTYSLQLLHAGAKNGPDPFDQWTEYVLPANLIVKGENKLYIMIESYGLSRQAFCFNDVRNGRGLLGVRLTSGSSALPFKLAATGVPVTTLVQQFGVAGFPDEDAKSGWKPVNAELIDGAAVLKHPDVGFGPLWFKTSFTLKEKPGALPEGYSLLSTFTGSKPPAASRRIPHRLIMGGPGTAHVFVDGIYIARYRGNGDSVQKDFVIPDKVLENAGSGEVPISVLVYGRSSDEWVSVRIGGWEIAEEGSPEQRWSGNLKEGGKVFSTVKEVLKV